MPELDERAVTTEERAVPSALMDHARQVTRVEEALESLCDRLSPVLSEARPEPSDDRLVAVTPHTDVPLAQGIRNETGRLETLERRLRDLYDRAGV